VNVRPCIVGVYRLHPAVFVVIPDGAIVFDDNVSDTCWRGRWATGEPATIWQPHGHIMGPIFAPRATILPDFDRAAVVKIPSDCPVVVLNLLAGTAKIVTIGMRNFFDPLAAFGQGKLGGLQQRREARVVAREVTAWKQEVTAWYVRPRREAWVARESPARKGEVTAWYVRPRREAWVDRGGTAREGVGTGWTWGRELDARIDGHDLTLGALTTDPGVLVGIGGRDLTVGALAMDRSALARHLA